VRLVPVLLIASTLSLTSCGRMVQVAVRNDSASELVGSIALDDARFSYSASTYLWVDPGTKTDYQAVTTGHKAMTYRTTESDTMNGGNAEVEIEDCDRQILAFLGSSQSPVWRATCE
jgi:hypothetical protein